MPEGGTDVTFDDQGGGGGVSPGLVCLTPGLIERLL